MRSALRTFTSALGLCAACYLLATASWQQVLLLFLVASIGWCWFAFSADEFDSLPGMAPNMKPRPNRRPRAKTPVSSAVREAQVTSRPERIQTVYRFPMHQLARPSFAPIAEFE